MYRKPLANYVWYCKIAVNTVGGYNHTITRAIS